MQDSVLNFGQDSTEKEFYSSTKEITMRKTADDEILRVVFSMNSVIYEHSREVYGVLDLIGDVGGLADGVGYIVQAILYVFSIVGFNPLLDYFVSH